MKPQKVRLHMNPFIGRSLALIAMLWLILSFTQPVLAQTPVPPTDPDRAGGLPAQGKCGVDGLGNYVKFTSGGGDGTNTATATGGNGGTLTATYTQSSVNRTFQINSLTLNSQPLLIAEVVGGAGSKNPLWVFTPSILAPTPVLATQSDKNFSQFALCVYDAIAPFSLTKTVDVGSGEFTFNVVCKSPTTNVVLLAKQVTLTVAAGTAQSVQVFGNVPIGAICTATETLAVPDTYNNNGPQSATMTTVTGAGVTINNTLNVGRLTLIKSVDNLGETGANLKSVSDFPLTINGNTTTSGAAVTVPVGNHTIAETTQPGYTVGAWSCTDNTTGASGSTTATVNIAGGENTTCTIVNTLIAQPALSIVKSASPENYSMVSQIINYTYLVTNIGNVTVQGPFTIDDDKVTNEACPGTPATLAPGATILCSASYAVTQADLDNGSVTNNATASGAYNGQTVTSPSTTATVTAVPNPRLQIDKSTTAATYANAGDVIIYTYAVENVGNVTLPAPISVTDNKISPVDCTQPDDGQLTPGEQTSCQGSYTITQADLDNGSVTNIATARADWQGQAIISPEDKVTVGATQRPALAIEKSAAPTTYKAAGNVIQYSYLVTNIGNVTINGPITVADDKSTDEACIQPADGSLAPGETTTCTATYTITQADLNSGAVVNIATAAGLFAGETVTSLTDTARVTANQMPNLSVEKTAAPLTYSTAGAVIQYTYLVKNEGNVTLNGPISVADDKSSDESCTQPDDGQLAPGETTTCTATYTITQADLDNGTVTNRATAGASFANQPVTSAEDTATVSAEQKPKLTVAKSASPVTYDALDDEIQYTYLVKNEGNVTLSAPFAVTDDKTTVECPTTPTQLAPQASITCMATYTITQADLDKGSLTNEAFATAFFKDQPVKSATVTATVTARQLPALQIAKTATPLTYDAVNDAINYSYLIINVGNVTLNAPFVVEDDKTAVQCPATPTKLAPEESLTCEATYAITQADLDDGTVTNQAYATTTFNNATVQSNTDSETVTAEQQPALTLEKSADAESYDAVGDRITYSYRLTNSGNVTLDGPFTVADDKVSDESCPALPATLAPGASITCTATYQIAQADLDAGSVTNLASATGSFAGRPVPSNTDTVTVDADQRPGLDLAKAGTVDLGVDDTAGVGDLIRYTFSVTNIGNVTLKNVTVSDPKLGLNCVIGELTPGAVHTACAADYLITQVDIDAGKVDNEATVTGAAPDDSSVHDEDANSESIPQAPMVEIDKEGLLNLTVPGQASVGDQIQYTLIVINTGNVTLNDVTIRDQKLGVTCTIGALAPGATNSTCTGVYVVTQSDIDGGKVENLAVVTGVTPGGDEVGDNDPNSEVVPQKPGLVLDKEGSLDLGDDGRATVGDTITYRFIVENNGNVTLKDITVTDPKVGLTCQIAELPAGSVDDTTCRATYQLTQADIDAGKVENLADAVGAPPAGDPVRDDDPNTTAIPQSPALLIDKEGVLHVGLDDEASVGDKITYSFRVENTGNVTLQDVTVTDTKLGLSCVIGLLLPGAVDTDTCTATYTLTQTDIDAGKVDNEVTVSGRPPIGGPVGDGDTATVTVLQAPALSISKSPNLQQVVSGNLATFTIKVKNTGNTTLYNVAVVDPLSPLCDRTIEQLAVNAEVEYTCTVTATADFTNEATVTGATPTGQTVEAEDTAVVDVVTPAIAINKQVSLDQMIWAETLAQTFVGTPIYYRFVVENAGDTALAYSVTDNTLAQWLGLDPSQPFCSGTLTVGGSVICGPFGPVAAGYADNNAIANIATGQGCFQGIYCDTDTDTATYTGMYWAFTPGFWKNHAPPKPSAGKNAWQYTAYKNAKTPLWQSPATPTGVFTKPICTPSLNIKDNATLVDALGFGGGQDLTGAAKNLLRAGVAALLNASFHETYVAANHPLALIGPHGELLGPEGMIYYPYSTTKLIALINNALASCNRDTMLALAAELDRYNNGIHLAPWSNTMTMAAALKARSVDTPVEGEEHGPQLYLPLIRR